MAQHKLFVQKYGGSSLKNAERIKAVASRIAGYIKKGSRVAVVVSAVGDTTDDLLDLAYSINESPAERELDMLMATGEQVSVAVLAMALHKIGIPAISFTGPQIGVITDEHHTKARIIDIRHTNRMHKKLKEGYVVIVAGFQGMNLQNDITTLGRGGSDMSAVALAKVLRADECEIFTDVDGVYTTDPRIVPEARKIPHVSYEEMLEMASLGAQVMQARSIEAAGKFDIPLHVRSSYSKRKGTIISREDKSMEDVLVRGVTLNEKEAKITIQDVPDKPGVAAEIFNHLASQSINVDMIIQNIGTTGKKTDLSFTVMTTDLKRTVALVNNLTKKLGSGKAIYDENIAKVSIVGIGMRSHSGVAAKMFATLAKKKINIDMISTSEIKISCVVAKKDGKKAVKSIHSAFKLGKK